MDNDVIIKTNGKLDVVDLDFKDKDLLDSEQLSNLDCVCYSNLKWYFNEINKYKILTEEEEKEIILKLDTRESDKAKELLILHNLRLVVSLARKYLYKSNLSFDELIQYGNIGLIKAASRYDSSQRVKFDTYAFYWIKESILNAINNYSRTIRLSVHASEYLYKMIDLYTKYGFDFTSRDSFIVNKVCEKLNISKKLFNRIACYMQTPLSLDKEFSNDSDFDFYEFVGDNKNNPELAVFKSERDKFVSDSLNLLNDREKDIIIRRFGLYDNDKQSLEDISKIYKISKERVRQIQIRAIDKLKTYMTKSLKDANGSFYDFIN